MATSFILIVHKLDKQDITSLGTALMVSLRLSAGEGNCMSLDISKGS
jgi:hypothetical protein